MTDPRYSSARWKRLRTYVRGRDHEQCQLRLPGCAGRAQAVDHIVEPGPPSLGRDDLFFNADNCQAACRACNTAKRNTRRNTLARQAEGPTPRFIETRYPLDIEPLSGEGTHYSWSRGGTRAIAAAANSDASTGHDPHFFSGDSDQHPPSGASLPGENSEVEKVMCASCGAELPAARPTGRPRKYCSTRCRRTLEFHVRWLRAALADVTDMLAMFERAADAFPLARAADLRLEHAALVEKLSELNAAPYPRRRER